MVYLYNLLSLALCWLYFVYLRKLGRVWHDNFLRFVIVGSTVAVLQFFLIYEDAIIIPILFITYYSSALIFHAIKLVVDDTKQKIIRSYETIKTNAPGSIKIKKLENNQYTVTLKWLPMKIAKLFQNLYVDTIVIFFKLLNWLHQYLPFIPGDHHLIYGVPKSKINSIVYLLKKASNKIKIKTEVSGIIIEDYFLRLMVEVDPKNKKNWYQYLQDYFSKFAEASDLNFRKEASKKSKHTISILFPRPSKKD